MIEPHNNHAGIVYIALAAVAGSITALSLLSWKTMSWGEIFMTLFVGTSFAVFGIPWLVVDLAGIEMDNLRVICGITYFGATAANVLVPLVIRKLKTMLGLEANA